MRKPKIPDQTCDSLFWDTNGDYKLEKIADDIKQNFESKNKWLYLGTDSINSRFAKIGITTGDLRSRSYSSARPTYYLFCAFKFDYKVTENQMRKVEEDILCRFNEVYALKRLSHYESNTLSECFDDIDFFQFFRDIHYTIYTHHRKDFVIAGFYNSEYDDYNSCEGEFVSCIFNPCLKDHNELIRMILQID